MTKSVNDEVLDAALDEIRDNATLEILCSAAPTTRTEAVTTYALADMAVTSTDFTKADGDVSGRKMTVAAQSDVDVDATGSGTHIALVDGTRLLYVTELASAVSVTSGGKVDLGAWDIEIADPT